ncbi:hypothetical protein SVIOM342S_07857 [Streptomyces violaceorubidus]
MDAHFNGSVPLAWALRCAGHGVGGEPAGADREHHGGRADRRPGGHRPAPRRHGQGGGRLGAVPPRQPVAGPRRPRPAHARLPQGLGRDDDRHVLRPRQRRSDGRRPRRLHPAVGSRTSSCGSPSRSRARSPRWRPARPTRGCSPSPTSSCPCAGPSSPSSAPPRRTRPTGRAGRTPTTAWASGSSGHSGRQPGVAFDERAVTGQWSVDQVPRSFRPPSDGPAVGMRSSSPTTAPGPPWCPTGSAPRRSIPACASPWG